MDINLKHVTKLIQAEPTKELFIKMLTRDLTLPDAVGELVDNAVDGARTLRPEKDGYKRLQPDERYKGLHIQIEANETTFSISDNCGGISAELARKYAFRFGRPSSMPKTPGSIGQFGLGMKRALFKLGKHFTISSTTRRSRFVVVVNVSEWQQKEEWDFQFKEIQELAEDAPDIPKSERGTTITVTELHQRVANSFKLENFITRLASEIEWEQLCNINRALTITINGYRLPTRQLQLLQSDDFRTAYWQKSYRDSLHIEMYAGIGSDDFEKGGWYLFCNDRMVLGPEQSALSGWGDRHIMPKYQQKFARFRGYLFFNADDASLLPWNTSKNNIDINSSVFPAIRLEMIFLMRSVIAFLKNWHQERQKIDNPTARTLAQALNLAKLVPLWQVVHTAPYFIAPQPPLPTKVMPEMKPILYHKPLQEIEKVRQFFGVNSLSKIGEKTFEYFYEMEFAD